MVLREIHPSIIDPFTSQRLRTLLETLYPNNADVKTPLQQALNHLSPTDRQMLAHENMINEEILTYIIFLERMNTLFDDHKHILQNPRRTPALLELFPSIIGALEEIPNQSSLAPIAKQTIHILNHTHAVFDKCRDEHGERLPGAHPQIAHMIDTTLLMTALCKQTQSLPIEDRCAMILALMWHDLGKTYDPHPFASTTKQKDFTPEQRATQQDHPLHSFQMASTILRDKINNNTHRIIDIIKMIALCHHYKPNEQGYLDGYPLDIDHLDTMPLYENIHLILMARVVDILSAKSHYRGYNLDMAMAQAFEALHKEHAPLFEKNPYLRHIFELMREVITQIYYNTPLTSGTHP